MIADQVLGELVKEQTLFRQSEHFLEVLISLQKNISKGLDRKRKKLVRPVLRTTYKRNRRLGNVLDMDLQTTYLQKVQSHKRRMINGKRKYVLMKKVIRNSTGAKITATKRYMHIWHICLVMANVLVEILVTVYN